MSEPLPFGAAELWREETLGQWLQRCVDERGSEPAIVLGGASTSYAELQEQAIRAAHGLARQGIGKGDIVAVQLPNIPEFLVAWFAINLLGAIMQTVHLPYGPREVRELLENSGAKAMIALGEVKGRSPAGEVISLGTALPNLQRVIAVGPAPTGTVPFAGLLECQQADPIGLPAVSGRDKYLLLYTSGTTASPKAVSVTYNHFLTNARLCADEFGIRADDRILCAAPFTHLYGLYAAELGFAKGAAACLLPSFSPPEFVAALRDLKPTVLFAGPAHVAACFQLGLLKDLDLSSLRFAVLSGSTVPPSLSEAFENLLPNGKVLQAWGMTELQFGACGRHADNRATRFGSIGRATPGTELRVADDGGAAVPAGSTGELQVRGCSLFSGYVRNPEANASAFTPDGWFRTGDLASMDEAGNVRLVGRTKELINRGGIKINPVDIEVAIAEHPAVAQVAIAPIPDPVLGERACCFIVLRDRASIDLHAITEHLAARNISKVVWPERLEVVAEMPMTPTRKIMKAELVRRIAPL